MTELTAPHPIHARAFLQALHDAGILGRDERVRRVVIDAHIDRAVIMHVERFGDERLLAVAASLNGVQITREEPA